jgi:hypothetical protein
MTARKSSRAFAKYQELVTEANAKPLKLVTAVDLTEAEVYWCDLTPLESWVFRIDPRLVNALVFAHVRYEDMIGTTDIEFEEFREEERAAFPEYFKDERCYSFDAAVGFMVTACELPFEPAVSWVARKFVQDMRSGLFGPDQAAPGWAYGPVDMTHVCPNPEAVRIERAWNDRADD